MLHVDAEQVLVAALRVQLRQPAADDAGREGEGHGREDKQQPTAEDEGRVKREK